MNTTPQQAPSLSTGSMLLLACTCGLLLANLYYAQPILADMAATIGLELAESGIIVTMLQIGYALGILFLVPLGDVVENRRLIACMVFGASLALMMGAWSPTQWTLLSASLFIGLFSAAMQVIIPFAVGLTPVNARGRIIGVLMAGAILGMVLSRPLASMSASMLGWRSIYMAAAVVMLVLTLVLYRFLPITAPATHGINYISMLKSMGRLLREVPHLPLRLSIAACIFAGFSMFWATAPMALRQNFQFSHAQIAFFALAGLITPPCAILAGRLIDRGYGTKLVLFASIFIALAFSLTALFGMYAAVFVLAVFLLDPSMNMSTMAIQQNVITSIPGAGSRLNALSASTTFCGGAVGSALGPWLFSHYGWQFVAFLGAVFMIIPFTLNLLLVRDRSNNTSILRRKAL